MAVANILVVEDEQAIAELPNKIGELVAKNKNVILSLNIDSKEIVGSIL